MALALQGCAVEAFIRPVKPLGDIGVFLPGGRRLQLIAVFFFEPGSLIRIVEQIISVPHVHGKCGEREPIDLTLIPGDFFPQSLIELLVRHERRVAKAFIAHEAFNRLKMAIGNKAA